MPFKALAKGQEFISFTLTDNEWFRITEKEFRTNLRMSCCESRAIPKESKLGTRFFSHHIKKGCEYKKETPQHLAAKKIIYEACDDEGWNTSTEVSGHTPEGKRWIADVLSTKGAARIAFEIQWSWQSMEDFRVRQKIYDKSGVRCAWFFKLRKLDNYEEDRRLELKSTYDIPMFGIKEDNGEFTLPHANNMNLGEFAQKLLRGDIGFWPRIGVPAELQFFAYSGRCPFCNNKIRILVKIVIIDASYKYRSGLERSITITGNDSEYFFRTARIHLPENTFGTVISKSQVRDIRIFPYSNVNRSCRKQMVNICESCNATLEPDPYSYEPVECEDTPFYVCTDVNLQTFDELGSWFAMDKAIQFNKSEVVYHIEEGEE